MPEPRFSIFDLGADPTKGIQGMPPNYGRALVPHALTFSATLSSISRVYRPSDEAMKHSLSNARLMVNDPVVEECCEIRRQAVCLFDWHIEPGDSKDQRQVDFAAELTKMLEAIPRFMQYRENLLRATFFGRYGIAQQWGWKKIGHTMRLIPKQWTPVHGDKFVFRYDDGSDDYRPDQIGILVGYPTDTWLRRYNTTREEDMAWNRDPVLKRMHEEMRPGSQNKIQQTDRGRAYFMDSWERPLLALHRHQIEDGEFEDPENAGRIHGKGLRSVIYWAWLQKQEALALLMEYMERSGFGLDLWPYPMHNPQAETSIKEAALRRGEAGGSRTLVFYPVPQGEDWQAYIPTHIEPSGAGIDALYNIIHTYFGHMIKRYILGQTLTSEAQATGLGSELANVQLGTFMQKLRYDAPLQDETITTDTIDPMIEYNAPEFADAGFRFVTDTESPDAMEKMEALEKAYNMGQKIPVKELSQITGVRQPEADEEYLSIVENQKAMQPPSPFGMLSGLDGDTGKFAGNSTNGHQPQTMAMPEGYAMTPNDGGDRERLIESSGERPEERTARVRMIAELVRREFDKRHNGSVAA